MRRHLVSAIAVPLIFLAQCAPDGCAPVPAPSPPPPGFGAGTVVVGNEVAPGVYFSTSTDACYWERLSGLGGSFGEIIANDFSLGAAQHIVEIKASDVAFSSRRCGRWVLFGPRPPLGTFGDGDWSVNVDVAPGRWQSDPAMTGCYWERASGHGHDFGEIIANDFLDGRAIVDIAASDVRFSSSRCGTWIPVVP